MMGTLRALVIGAVLTVVTLPLMVVQWVLRKTGSDLAFKLPYFYHRGVARLMGLKIVVTGRPVHGSCLMVANHASWLDIVVLSAVKPLSFIAKGEVGSWPVFGSLARLQRTVFIDRDNRAATGRFSERIRARLAKGDTLVLFAEGTSSDGNRVLPFKSALMGAVEPRKGHEVDDILVQPVTIAYTNLYGLPMGRMRRPSFAWYGDMELVPHLWQALSLGPVDVRVVLHEPIALDRGLDRKALAIHCEKAVRHGLVRALGGHAPDDALYPAPDANLNQSGRQNPDHRHMAA